MVSTPPSGVYRGGACGARPRALIWQVSIQYKRLVLKYNYGDLQIKELAPGVIQIQEWIPDLTKPRHMTNPSKPSEA